MNLNTLVFIFLMFSIGYCAIIRDKSYVIDNSSGERCFITIILDTNRKVLPIEEIQKIKTYRCEINYFYVITHSIDYTESVVQNEAVIRYPYIIRSTWKESGYLSFIVPLLRSSDYTLVIKDEDFSRLPDGAWIDNAISLLPLKGPSVVVSCAPEGTSQVNEAEGCMLMRSMELRMIMVNTEFRRPEIDPFSYFSEAFKCKYSSFINFYPYYAYNPKSSHLRSAQVGNWDFAKLKENCEAVLGLENVGCTSSKSRRHSASFVLSQYKREYYMEQIEGIYSSTIQVDEVVVYQNGIHMNYKPLFQRYPNISHVWSVNWNSPFFFRHLIPLIFTSDYHIVMDDDIIPSRNTLKKLITIIDKYDAPSGVNSRTVYESDYKEDTYKLLGSESLNVDDAEVDFVIQVYAKSYLMTKVYWRYRPYTHRNGDDMHGSITWFMECKRRPHFVKFVKDEEFKNYGRDSVASYITKTHQKVRPQTYRSWVMAGFKGMKDPSFKVKYPQSLPEWEKEYLLRNHKLC